jgi:hypothetical protein
MHPSSLVDLLGSECDAVSDHVWRRVCRDNNVLQAHSVGLGRALVFESVRSLRFGEVDSLSLVNLVLLIKIRIVNRVLTVSSCTGPFTLLVVMMHSQANTIGVEVVGSLHLISRVILGRIIHHFPDLGKNV